LLVAMLVQCMLWLCVRLCDRVCGKAVERRSLTGELSLSHTRPVADG